MASASLSSSRAQMIVIAPACANLIAAARPIYALYGKPDNLQANYPESEHDFPTDARDVAYRFLEKHLK